MTHPLPNPPPLRGRGGWGVKVHEGMKQRVLPQLRDNAAGHGGRPAPSSRFRGGTLTGELTWVYALKGDGSLAVAVSFITKRSAAEPLRVSSSTSVGSGRVVV
jgi:hypothetical protein